MSGRAVVGFGLIRVGADESEADFGSCGTDPTEDVGVVAGSMGFSDPVSVATSAVSVLVSAPVPSAEVVEEK